MGLDMYLYRRLYVEDWDHLPAERKPKVTLWVGGAEVPLVRPTYLYDQVGYWRKANQVHKFFVDLADGRDECQEIYVESAQLAELVERCEQVLDDHSLARELLPVQVGFFFGGTEYDDYYFETLSRTSALIKQLLRENPADQARDGFIYRASW